MAGLGNPVRPNGPARCITLARYARPVGVLSAQAARTLPLSLPGRATSGITPSGARDTAGEFPAGGEAAGRKAAGGEAGTPASGYRGPSRRRHSFLATACSQGRSRSGSVSSASFAAAMMKVSCTAWAALPIGSGSGSMNRQ